MGVSGELFYFLGRFDLCVAAEQYGYDQQNYEGSRGGTEPESLPVAHGARAAASREEIERVAGYQRAGVHPDAVGHKRDEALRGAAQMRGRLLVRIKLARHEEEVIANAVQQDRDVKHPYARACVAQRQQRVANRPGG